MAYATTEDLIIVERILVRARASYVDSNSTPLAIRKAAQALLPDEREAENYIYLAEDYYEVAIDKMRQELVRMALEIVDQDYLALGGKDNIGVQP